VRPIKMPPLGHKSISLRMGGTATVCLQAATSCTATCALCRRSSGNGRLSRNISQTRWHTDCLVRTALSFSRTSLTSSQPEEAQSLKPFTESVPGIFCYCKVLINNGNWRFTQIANAAPGELEPVASSGTSLKFLCGGPIRQPSLPEERRLMLEESTDRRSMRRFDMRLPAAIRFSDGALAEFFTETQNVSARGVFFYLDREVAAGSRIEVTLTFPPHITLTDAVRVRFAARVIRVEPPSPSSRP